LVPLLNLLLLPHLRRYSPRFLPAFSSTGLIRRFAGRFTRNVRFCGIRRFAAGASFFALFRARLIGGRVLIHPAALLIHPAASLYRTGFFGWSPLRPGRIRAWLRFSYVRFFRGALAL
jgi:hypothetical protein